MHISFVRSISMDAFKPGEIERMRLGGNDRWRAFYTSHQDGASRGLTWDAAAPTAELIAERYSGHVGDEYKDRLACLVDGRDYVPPASPREKRTASTPVIPAAAVAAAVAARSISRSNTPVSATGGGASSNSPRVRVDDAYFARLGADNAARPNDLPPSMGGKYAGFGNMPSPQTPSSLSRKGEALPSYEDLQRDPVGALSKGLGWFTNTVSKTAKSVNDGYIQPTAAKVCFFPFFFAAFPIPLPSLLLGCSFL